MSFMDVLAFLPTVNLVSRLWRTSGRYYTYIMEGAPSENPHTLHFEFNYLFHNQFMTWLPLLYPQPEEGEQG